VNHDVFGKRDSPGIRERLDPGSDVDRVAHNILSAPLHIAQVDPDPKPERSRSLGDVALVDGPLKVNGTLDGIERIRELDENPVSDRLDLPSVMP